MVTDQLPQWAGPRHVPRWGGWRGRLGWAVVGLAVTALSVRAAEADGLPPLPGDAAPRLMGPSPARAGETLDLPIPPPRWPAPKPKTTATATVTTRSTARPRPDDARVRRAAQGPEPPAPIEPAPVPIEPGAMPVFRQVPDTTGLVPQRPPGPPAPQPPGEVARQVNELIELVQEPEAEINVVLGRSKLIRARANQRFTRIVVADPNVAEVQLLDSPQLLNIYGLSFGQTNLTLFDDQNHPISFLVRVTIDTKDLETRIKQVFPSAQITIKQVGSQVILEGQVPDAKTMAEVLQLVENVLLGARGGGGGAGSGGGGGGLSKTGPKAEWDRAVARAAFEPQQTAPGGPTVIDQPGQTGAGASTAATAPPQTAAPQTNVVVGGVGGPGMVAPPRAGGGGLAPGTIINRVHVPGPRQILLHVKIAELNRTALRQIGVSWMDTRNQMLIGSLIGGAGNVAATGTATQNSLFQPPRYGQGVLPVPGAIQPVISNFGPVTGTFGTGINTQLFGIFNAGEFNIFLNALRQNSLAKVLSEPNLVTLDGQPAHFLAGGRYPYAVPQASTFGGPVITYQFQEFGAILQFIPHILENDVIRLDVNPVYSELNFATATVNPQTGQAVPSINQRSARTVVELREGQTLAIAGLLQTTTNASTSRVPILGDIPIVGPWFSRNEVQTVETELVVLVTPELVAPIEKCDVPPAPGDKVTQPTDIEFYFLGRIEGRTGRPFRATLHELDPLDLMKHFTSEDHWVVGPHGHAD